MLTAFLGRLAEPWAVQAVEEETRSAVVEPDTDCGSGDGAAAAALGCSAETAFWLSPPPALHLQHVPLPGPRTHSVTGTSVVGLVVGAVPRGWRGRVGWDGRLWLGR